MSSKIWTIIAGVSGFTSVGLAAYGRHSLPEIAAGKDFNYRKELWGIGNQMHMVHSVALLGLPLIKKPYFHLAGSALLLGMAGFSGSMYTRAYYGEAIFDSRITQSGGALLGIGWLLFCVFPK